MKKNNDVESLDDWVKKAAKYFVDTYGGKYVAEKSSAFLERRYYLYKINATQKQIESLLKNGKAEYTCMNTNVVSIMCYPFPGADFSFQINYNNMDFDWGEITFCIGKFYNPYIPPDYFDSYNLPSDFRVENLPKKGHPLSGIMMIDDKQASVLDSLITKRNKKMDEVYDLEDKLSDQIKELKMENIK